MDEKPAKRAKRGESPIIAIRVPPDVKLVLDTLAERSEGKFKISSFVLGALEQKLERDFPLEFLKELGYIKPF